MIVMKLKWVSTAAVQLQMYCKTDVQTPVPLEKHFILEI